MNIWQDSNNNPYPELTEEKFKKILDDIIPSIRKQLDDDFERIIVGGNLYIKKADWIKLWEFEQENKHPGYIAGVDPFKE